MSPVYMLRMIRPPACSGEHDDTCSGERDAKRQPNFPIKKQEIIPYIKVVTNGTPGVKRTPWNR